MAPMKQMMMDAPLNWNDSSQISKIFDININICYEKKKKGIL